MYNAQSVFVLVQICMLPLKVYVFSEQGDQTPIKTNDPGDLASRTASRLLTEMLHPHTTLQSGPNNHPYFLRVPKDYQCPQLTRSLENYAHPSKILVINVCFHLRGFVYKLVLVIVVSPQVL